MIDLIRFDQIIQFNQSITTGLRGGDEARARPARARQRGRIGQAPRHARRRDVGDL